MMRARPHRSLRLEEDFACRLTVGAHQGDPCVARSRAALTGDAAGGVSSRNSRRRCAMSTLTAFAAIAILTGPGFAQTQGLETGFYAIVGEDCASASGTAVMSYDGRSFINHGVECRFISSVNEAGAYSVRCVEDHDERFSETMSWRFTTLSPTSFKINNNIYRKCDANP